MDGSQHASGCAESSDPEETVEWRKTKLMAERPITSNNTREPSYMDAIVPLITLIVLIAGSVSLFGSSAVDGPMQVALILSVMVDLLHHSQERAPLGIHRQVLADCAFLHCQPDFHFACRRCTDWRLEHVRHNPNVGLLRHSIAAAGLFLSRDRADLWRDITRHREVRGRRPARSVWDWSGSHP